MTVYECSQKTEVKDGGVEYFKCVTVNQQHIIAPFWFFCGAFREKEKKKEHSRLINQSVCVRDVHCASTCGFNLCFLLRPTPLCPSQALVTTEDVFVVQNKS